MKVICYLTLLMLFVSCNSGENNQTDWRRQVAEIDREIERLSSSKSSLEHQSNEEQRQSLNYMRDDWGRYSQKIEEVEKDYKQEKEIDTRIEQLKAKKASLLQHHQKDRV